MTPFAYFAFWGVPLIVAALGWAAVFLHGRLTAQERDAAQTKAHVQAR